jgi:hypothetical protein
MVAAFKGTTVQSKSIEMLKSLALALVTFDIRQCEILHNVRLFSSEQKPG